ncbi:MAG: SpoIIIAH-like family protein [Bacillota bacterium]|nr:SpoIIIAH-like family protein [Bacillota bacterium]
MNKKQIVVIVTLLVLIVCAGILATYNNGSNPVNSPLNVDNTSTDGTKNAVSSSNSNTKDDFFTSEKLSREKTYTTSITTLKSLIDDPNTPNESKAAASDKYNLLTVTQVTENKVESALKAKGYDLSLCEITDGKATVSVKVKDKQLTDKDAKVIQGVVMSVASIGPDNIEIMPKS